MMLNSLFSLIIINNLSLSRDDLIAKHFFIVFKIIELVLRQLMMLLYFNISPNCPHLPEPNSLDIILSILPKIKEGWLKAVRKELKGVIEENATFRRENTTWS